MSKEGQKPLKVSGTFSSEKVPDTLQLRETARTLPDLPGIYQFKNATGAILYIGKAKSLKKRVAQYFAPLRLEPLKQEMVKLARSVETIIVKNETEALVLEGTLIHKHQPPYNVRLVDDTSYLYIRVSDETYPRVSLERKVKTDDAWYRGPYPNARAVRQTLKEARKFFPWCDKINEMTRRGGRPRPPEHDVVAGARGRAPLRNDGVSLPYSRLHTHRRCCPDGLKGGDGFDRACFAYHIGLCPGICVGAIGLEEYQKNFTRLKKFLDGDTAAVLDAITERMNRLSDRQDYEKAAALRDKIKAIKQTMVQQDVITAKSENADVFGLAHRGGHGSVAMLQLRQGRIIGRQIFSLLLPDEKEEKEIWEEFLAQYLPTAQGSTNIIYLPPTGAIHELPLHAQLVFPKRGWKKQLIDMAKINAQESLKKSETELQSPQNLLRSITDLKEKLNLPELPKRIETYDISNIQGTLATASMVVFIDGKPAPSEYRKFKIINDGEPNDVGMMREVLTRRLARISPFTKGGLRGISKADNKTHPRPLAHQGNTADACATLIREGNAWPLPDLIVLDGGKPQLNTIHKLFIDLGINIPLISLAKREEEIFTPSSSLPIVLDRASSAFYLMQRMRDEAHRFTISYHRLLRKKRMTKSILEEIPGIGPGTRKKLLRAFGSLSQIKSANTEEIKKVLGSKKKAELLKNFLGK